MQKLIFQIEKDEDGVWVAQSLDLGIATQGDTLDMLFANILDAIKLHYSSSSPNIELVFDILKSSEIYA